MKLLKKYSKEISFPTNISEISSISMDIESNYFESKLGGKLNLCGDYVTSELENIKNDFSYILDFEYELDDNVIPSSVKADIDDFTYDIDQNNLTVNVDIEITYEQEEINEREALDKFLAEHEVDLVNLRNEETVEDGFLEEMPMEEDLPNNCEEDDETRSRENIENNILEYTTDTKDEYITYHIYIVNETDTLVSIADKYHITVDEIKEYNEIENIKSGMKLVIPCSNE